MPFVRSPKFHSLVLFSLISLWGMLFSKTDGRAEQVPTSQAASILEEPALIHADIVALDQLIVYNRFGSFDPYGMIFSLRRDVTANEAGTLIEPKRAKDCGELTGTEAGSGPLLAGQVRLKDCKRPRPLVLRARMGDILQVNVTNLLRPPPGMSETFCKSETKSDNASVPQPQLSYLRAHVTSDEVAANANGPFGEPICKSGKADEAGKAVGPGESDDWPFTRNLSFVIPGLELIKEEAGKEGVCRGTNAIRQNESVTCTYRVTQEGTHLFQSMAAPSGGQGNGGSLTHGLFGALVVEPKGSSFYRSQVTHAAFDEVWSRNDAPDAAIHSRKENLKFEKAVPVASTEKSELFSASNPCAVSAGTTVDVPILNMLRNCGVGEFELDAGKAGKHKYFSTQEIVHGDLNAVIAAKPVAYDESSQSQGPFREFVVIFHDELKTYYTKELEDLEKFGQFSGVRDGFAINYGASGAGSIVLANRKGIGPARDCAECLYEEFFLESWANGDPALLESFPDDPSNVHHSYLNDRIVFRNFHAGPKETHVFHLHAHQWYTGNDENRGAYLDSQTIGPQQGMSYNIYQGGMNVYRPKTPYAEKGGFWETLGSGNRNRTPGDAIFHCHLYPHFAQGMWELWRTHDVLEDGSRTLPDGQLDEGLSLAASQPKGKRGGTPLTKVANVKSGPALWHDKEVANPGKEGTPVPGIIPLPDQAAPLLPSYDEVAGFPGYPYYIPGVAGHRTPQAPFDIAVDVDSQNKSTIRDGGLGRHVVIGGARKTSGEAPFPKSVAQKLALGDLTEEFDHLQIRLLPQNGTPLEKRAMAFHHNGLIEANNTASKLKLFRVDGKDATIPGVQAATTTEPLESKIAYGTLTMKRDAPLSESFFAVNGAPPKPGAPFADPCGVPDALANAPMNDPFSFRSWANKTFHYGSQRPFPYWEKVAAGQDRSQEQSGFFGVEQNMTYDPALTGFRRFRASAVQLDMAVNRAGWHDPQARINVSTQHSDDYKNNIENPVGGQEPYYFRAFSGECIEFRHTNELPKDLERDDFQMKVPTDTIGQHIHLVKFDVTSADGSGNGWNYEDGTFAPDELAARIKAAKAAGGGYENVENGTTTIGQFPSQLAGESAKEAELRIKSRESWNLTCGKQEEHLKKKEIWKLKRSDFEACFQTTVQRWFADPMLSPTGEDGKYAGTDGNKGQFAPPMADRTLRTVFTHDHFGPSNIQQHGFYSALLIEPPLKAAAVYKANGTSTPAVFTPEWGIAGGVTDRACNRLAYLRAEDSFKSKMKDLSQLDSTTKHFLLSCPMEPPLVTAMGDLNAAEQMSEQGVGSRAIVSKRTDVSDNSDPYHLNYREFALSIADFALLYDGKKKNVEIIDTIDDDNRGLDRLIADARKALSQKKRDDVCNWTATAKDEGDFSPADAVRCTDDNGEWLKAAELQLEEDTKRIRKDEGEPVNPPERPEAISQTHHDPYLVNYRNEPIPLRIGQTSALSNNSLTKDDACPDNVLFESPDRFSADSISKQRPGDDGDMARVFRTAEHGEPCTPILEAYANERVVVRLIQGAQEVQHLFTVEGRTFRRNVDQNFEYGAWIKPDPDQKPGATRWLHCMKAAMASRPFQHTAWFGGGDSFNINRNTKWLERYRTLAAECDNVAGDVTAQEIGISEHFEFTGKFSSDSGAQAEGRPTPTALSSEALRKDPYASVGLRDNLYHFGTVDALWNGAWGLIRTYAEERVMDHNATNDAPIGDRLTRVPRELGAEGAAPQTANFIVRQVTNGTQNSYRITETLSYPGLSCPFIKKPAPLLATDRTPVESPDTDKLLAAFHQAPHSISGVVAISARDVMQDAKLKGIIYNASNGIYDPDGLVLVPLHEDDLNHIGVTADRVYDADRKSLVDRTTGDQDGSVDLGIDTERLMNIVQSRGLRPYVLRINAGDCHRLVVINMLKNHDSQQVGANHSGLRDAPGDAWMPRITRLNTDQLIVDGGQEKFISNIGEVTPSASLALSIPISVMSNVNDLPDPVGRNPQLALKPKTNGSAPKTAVMTLFAGNIGFEHLWLDKIIANASLKRGEEAALAFESNGPKPSTKDVEFNNQIFGNGRCEYDGGGESRRLVIWPNDKRLCLEGVNGEVSINVLGRKYCAVEERVLNSEVVGPLSSSPPMAMLQSCVTSLLHTELNGSPGSMGLAKDMNLRVVPRAYGALPVKSIADPISHGVHGLGGALLVEPMSANYAERVVKEQPAIASGLTRITYLQDSGPPQDGTIVPFSWSKVIASNAIHDLESRIAMQDIALAAIPGMDDYGTTDTVIPGNLIHERTMFWQDGLNLWDGRRRPYFKDGCNLKDGEISCANDSYVGGPIPDCPACDDSYDWGEKGVNYSSAPLFARVRDKDVSYWELPETNASAAKEASVRLPKRLGPDELRSLCDAPVYYAGHNPAKEYCGSDEDINKLQNSLGAWPLPATLFASTWLEPLPLPLIIEMPADSEVSLRIIAQQGRARQRAFVPIGMSYADTFPGFGSGHTSLLAPGKTLNAALGTPSLEGDYMWFDGPRQHVDGGAWGLLRIIPK